MPHSARHKSISVPAVITPPPPAGYTPRDLTFFSNYLAAYSPPPGLQSTSTTSVREQKRVAVFVAVKRQKQSFYQVRSNAFLEFIERKKLRGVMQKYHTNIVLFQSLSAFPQIS